MKTQLLALLCLTLLGSAVVGKAPEPVISRPGKQLLNEEFSGNTIPSQWKPGGRPNSFNIVEGALQGVCPPDDGHGPAISVPIEGKNLTIAFSIKGVKPGVFLFLVDGQSQFGGDAHLLRLAMHGGGTAIQQDRGSPESKKQQAEQRAKATADGKKAPPPTKEQLDDPKFYRTEVLAKDPVKLLDGNWHQVLFEIRGDEVAAQVDDKVKLLAKATVADVPKSKLVFLVGASGTILIDNVKVWENAAR